jgi:membrane-bound serine protease (ClpP class)
MLWLALLALLPATQVPWLDALSSTAFTMPRAYAQGGSDLSGESALDDGIAAFAAADARSIRIDGPITKVAYDYLDRAMAVAESESALLVVELATPGGDTGSMGLITERFLNSEVPVVVWVGPRGAQAASAGTFIVLAAHAAGMAPATVIGAASPVGASGEDLGETMLDKVTEDLSAQARNLAARRGEEAVDWAERAVRDAVSATAEEALALGVIDAVAEDPESLLRALDGLTIEVAGAEARIEAPDDAVIAPRPIERNAAERLLALLVQPAIALLLLTLGAQAILIELSNPGGYVAGAIGVVALVLGFYSLGALEANYVGLAFFAVAIVLFVLELQTPAKGLFVALGALLFVLGSVILFADTAFGVPWLTVIGLTVASAAFVIFVLGAIWRAMHRAPVTGFEGMVGRKAEVTGALSPRGKVLIDGEIWDAKLLPPGDGGGAAAGTVGPVDPAAVAVHPAGGVTTAGAASTGRRVEVGEEVEVVGRDGFTLQVRVVG